MSQVLEWLLGTLLVVGIAAIVWALWPHAGDEPLRPPQRRPAWRAYLLLAAVIVGLSLLPPTGLLDRVTPGSESGDAAEEPSTSAASPSAVSRWGPMLLTVALGFAVLAIAAQRQRTAAVADEHDIADDIEQVAPDLTRASTPGTAAMGGDSRGRVLRAYARMEAELDAAGLPRRRTEAPGEYSARVGRVAPHTGRAVAGLTAAYEVARFADRPVDEAHAASAEAALDQLLAAWRQVAP